ncbi:MAG: hypothetical protein JOZ74_01195 [Bradyrhizobium sp.]|nr:hypothetical protein [Bradyrhizobium sp.]
MTVSRHIRFFGSGANWMKMSSILALRLGGYQPLLPPGSTVSVSTSEPGLSCFDGPERVAAGEFDIGISTPIWVGTLAAEGKLPFTAPLRIASLGCFPHDDRLVFAIRKETGLKSFQDIKQQRYPLRISTAPRETRHPCVWGAEKVLEEYGFDFADIESWGGEILRDRPRDISKPMGQKMIDPGFSAIFDEAIMTCRWRSVSDEYDLTYLPIEDEVLSSLERKGWRRGVLRQGFFRGLDADLPCVDFSGWYLYCREDLDDDLAYLTIQAIDEQKAVIERSYEPCEGLSLPVDLAQMCRNPPTPLHPGAERYYREKGYLS